MEEINLSPTGDNLYIYTRVSTDQQVEKGSSLEEQKHRGIEFAKKNGYGTCFIYEERGKSASGDDLSNRPAFSRLLGEITNKNVNHLYVFDTTRLSRNDLTNAFITSKFKQYGVRLFTSTGEIDFRNDMAVIHHTLINAVNLFDASNRKKRFQLGNVAANKKGKFTNPITPYGWRKYSGDNPSLKGFLEINPEEAQIVTDIIKMYLEQDMGTTQIARTLNSNNIPTRMFSKGYTLKQGVSNRKEARSKLFNPWNPGTINTMLQNTCLYGQRKFKIGINADGESQYEYVECPAIIDETTFNNLQQKRQYNHKKLKKTPKYFKLLSGLCVCSCGCSMELRIKPSRKEYTYVCNSKRSTATSCESRGINMYLLNDIVWKVITNIHYFDAGFRSLYNLILKDEKSLHKRSEDLCKEQKKTEENLLNIRAEIEKLIYMFTSGKISEALFDSINEKYISEQTALERRLLHLQTENHNIENIKQNEDVLSRICSKFSANFSIESQYLSQMQEGINDYNCKPTNMQLEARNFIRRIVDRICITFHEQKNSEPSFHEVKIVFNIGNGIKRDFIEKVECEQAEIKSIKKRTFLKQTPFISPHFITEPSR